MLRNDMLESAISRQTDGPVGLRKDCTPQRNRKRDRDEGGWKIVKAIRVLQQRQGSQLASVGSGSPKFLWPAGTICYRTDRHESLLPYLSVILALQTALSFLPFHPPPSSSTSPRPPLLTIDQPQTSKVVGCSSPAPLTAFVKLLVLLTSRGKLKYSFT